jgi:hypothetical protein
MADGFLLEASLIKPPDFDPNHTYPVWFTTYAGPHAPTISDAWQGGRAADHMLAQMGALVFECDPRTASGKGETLKRTASGTAAWDIVKGKFAKASLLAFISKHTGIKGLEDMTFDRMHGELRLSKGWILIDRVGVDGSLAKLDGAGKIGWDGVLDGRVSTRITPALADRVQIRCVTGLLRGADGLFALPVVVAVKGTVRAPEYHVEFTGEKAKSAAGSFSDLLRGCREDSSQPETTPAAAGQ